jgi:hypothetical protein
MIVDEAGRRHPGDQRALDRSFVLHAEQLAAHPVRR